MNPNVSSNNRVMGSLFFVSLFNCAASHYSPPPNNVAHEVQSFGFKQFFTEFDFTFDISTVFFCGDKSCVDEAIARRVLRAHSSTGGREGSNLDSVYPTSVSSNKHFRTRKCVLVDLTMTTTLIY